MLRPSDRDLTALVLIVLVAFGYGWQSGNRAEVFAFAGALLAVYVLGRSHP